MNWTGKESSPDQNTTIDNFADIAEFNEAIGNDDKDDSLYIPTHLPQQVKNYDVSIHEDDYERN